MQMALWDLIIDLLLGKSIQKVLEKIQKILPTAVRLSWYLDNI